MSWSPCEALTCWKERSGHARKLSGRPELSSAVPCFACRTPACECQNEIRECCTAADISSRGAGQRRGPGRPKIRFGIHRQLGQLEDPHICRASIRTGTEAAVFGMRQQGHSLPARAPHRQEELTYACLAPSSPADAGPAALLHPLQPNSSCALSGRILPVGRMEGRNS